MQNPQHFVSAGAPNDMTPPGAQSTQNIGHGSNITLNTVTNSGIDRRHSGLPQLQNFLPVGAVGPPQLPLTQISSNMYSQPSTPTGGLPNDSVLVGLPPVRPVFGVSLEDLLKRDGSAIPFVVYQCLQAVDLFGLEVEGIYRLSGSAAHVTKLRALFDNGNLAPNSCSKSCANHV